MSSGLAEKKKKNTIESSMNRRWFYASIFILHNNLKCQIENKYILVYFFVGQITMFKWSIVPSDWIEGDEGDENLW